MRIQKREHNKKALGRIAKGMLTAAGMAVMLWCMPIISLADATGKVIPNSVNIRKSPDVNSEVVGSSTGGKTVSIKGKVSASGTTWYQVYVQGAEMGYIRADMIETEAGADIPTVSALLLMRHRNRHLLTAAGRRILLPAAPRQGRMSLWIYSMPRLR